MRTVATIGLAVLLLGTAACDRTGAYGDPTSIIAAMEPDLWAQVEEDVQQVLEPTIQTVRQERTFTVTYQTPYEEIWMRLRQFKQMLLVGTGDEVWMEDALRKVDDAENLPRPTVVQVRDVWARAQLVTLVLLPEENQAEALRTQLDDLQQIYDRQYRTLALQRMYISGQDSALADTLSQEAGFSLLLPEVYYWDRRDSVYIFRNDNPDPSELIRQVAVTWRTPLPDELDGEEILEWRTALANEYYNDAQVLELSDVRAGPFSFGDLSAYQVQAVWQNPPESNWPAAGPFILWAVACPQQDRLYLLDAWLYAPGREKYQYMIQLETILNSFACES